MKPVDYIYRFDPKSSSEKPLPTSSEFAKQELESGNRLFAEWMRSCETDSASPVQSPYIIECCGFKAGHFLSPGEVPKQAPFAVVVGCSDARVPIEMLFGQGFNELFVIRVAGNILADECWGSIGYALEEMSASIKLIVILGHSGCGAVTAAVDAYLDPRRAASDSMMLAVRSIVDRLFLSVHRAAIGLQAIWGPAASDRPEYRRALIESSVCLNAAAAAYNVRTANERTLRADVRVVYGVYDLTSHCVSMPPVSMLTSKSDLRISLADAPLDSVEFEKLARENAERMDSQ
jgi:carbonic anhydrase